MNLDEWITVGCFLFPIALIVYLIIREQPTTRVDVDRPKYGCGLAAMPDISEEQKENEELLK